VTIDRLRETLAVWRNPLMTKGVRMRLRLRHAASWGLITITVATFLTMGVYLAALERGEQTPETAAKATIVPMIVVQAVILMLLGTGAVASSVGEERDKRLLDYQRMSPMGPGEKILGYLFGPPAREYFLFALTLPFVAWATWRSGMPPLKMLHFYGVFLLSVWLYHMSAIVVGMTSAKPRLNLVLTQGLVVVLYLVLPSLTQLGLTFFEYLTFRPTLYGMIGEEVWATSEAAGRMAEQQFSQIERFKRARFFEMSLHPSVMTLLVEGLLLLGMWVIAWRRWRDDEAHHLSKAGGALAMAAVGVMIVGSAWPLLTHPESMTRLVDRLDMGGAAGAGVVERGPTPEERLGAMAVVSIAALLAAAAFGALLIWAITPSRFTIVKGYRRARKVGARRVPLNGDAASSLPATIVMAILAAGTWAVILWLGRREGFLLTEPSLWTMAAPGALLIGIALFTQGLQERCSQRITITAGFMLWMVPIFAAIVLLAARDAWDAASWLALPNPAVALVYAALSVFHEAGAGTGWLYAPEPIADDLEALTGAGAAFYLALGAGMQVERFRWRRALGAQTLAESVGSGAEHLAGTRATVAALGSTAQRSTDPTAV